MAYTADERETVIRSDDVDRVWEVYTAQPTIMTKLRKSGTKPYWVETEKNDKGEERIIAAKYRLTWRQISILKPTSSNKGRAFKKPIVSVESEEE